jgi:hypothetical protein
MSLRRPSQLLDEGDKNLDMEMEYVDGHRPTTNVGWQYWSCISTIDQVKQEI